VLHLATALLLLALSWRRLRRSDLWARAFGSLGYHADLRFSACGSFRNDDKTAV
jgi:hypothetical protein